MERMTRLEVSIKALMTKNEVRIRQLEKWLASTPKSPRHSVLKSRVRELIGARVGSD
jgi:hypothetical protein